MSKIAYILLCHKDPDRIIEQARILISADDYLVIHFDRNAPVDAFRKVSQAFDGHAAVRFAKRVACGWGEWSLVQASLNALQTAQAEFLDATHFALVSGDCMPIKPAAYIHAKLDADDCDIIEHNPFFESDWVKVGLKEERLAYRHYFNERTQKALFYGSLALQQKLGLSRKPPKDLRIMIGSQWFILRRRTIEAILELLEQRADIARFFKTTWIPDETFFQTLVLHLVPKAEVRSYTPTFLMFSDYGMPVNFYDDHFDLLRAQDFFFARKISEHSPALRARLGALYTSQDQNFPISNSGHKLYDYVRTKGRVGKRVGPRIWEKGSSIGRPNQLLIVVCKKWHIARRLCTQLDGDLASYGYLFDNDADQLPSLGNLESSLEKRNRHRRAFLRLLFDYHNNDRLLICLDPARLDVLRDFASDGCDLRVLEVQSPLDNAFLEGHAHRIGLGGSANGEAFMAEVLSTLRREIEAESTALHEINLERLERISPDQPTHKNIAALASFLSISNDKAQKIAETPNLYL